MLKYKPQPYKESQLQYYSYINYNFVNDYLLEEDNVLSNIDADLPTSKELVEQRKRYNDLSKKMDSQIRKQRANKILNPHFLYENQISICEDEYDVYVIDRDGSKIKWDWDTYHYFKNKKGFKFKHVPKF